jgi:hypothetical protein
VKKLTMVLLVILLASGGCKWLPAALKSYQQEYDELAAQPAATTAADAKKQYAEVDEFVKRLKAEDQENLPDGLLVKAVELDAKRLAHCASLAFQEKAKGVWEWAKKKLHSDGVSPKEAAKIEPELAGPLKAATSTTTTTSTEPDDDRSHYR